MAYAELLCRTHYSFLEGASHPEELIQQAAAMGLRALAITDRDGVYGIPKAYVAARSLPHLHFITGATLTLKEHPPIALLARDRAAYGVLCRLLTESHRDAPKGEAFLPWSQFVSMLGELPGSRGLVALPREEAPSLRKEAALMRLPRLAPHDWGALRDLFGDRLYLPLRRHLDGQDEARTRSAIELQKRFGVPILATNDAYYHEPSRRMLQDVLTATRLNTSLAGAGRRLFSNGERHLKSALEMAALFPDLPEALARTVEVAESCTFSPAELRYRYPSEWIPGGHTAQSWMEHLVREGCRTRYPDGVPEAVERQLQHEFQLVKELQFADYFLTIWEIVDFARSRGILCQGRGSAANSAICYCLGITAVDPVRMNLLFERFLSAERGEPPDIDVDFEHERREEVIQHIYERYGRDRAAMVSAVITYRTRSAIRDVNRALGLDPGAAETKNWLADRLTEDLRGFPRHLSIHSGGFTLSADPIVEIVPVEPARMEGRTIIQWDKNDLDALGLLKVDILALGMLTAIRKSLDQIGMKDLAAIPAEDPATYAMIQKADTVGVFQIESRAQMNMLGRLKPRTFYDLVIEVALVRPGPIVGKMVHPYLKRRQGLEPVDIPDPRLDPILARTLGVPLFQEQVMKMAIVLADFTPGEADQLRRAIGAWRSTGSIEEMGMKLREGLLRNGLPEKFVDLIFTQIQGFAEYGFPESHAASFALLAYASSWLKCHHPAEFTCALINSQPLGFYSNSTLVEDARRHGVRVLPVHPNHSAWDCQLVPDPHTEVPRDARALQLGWRIVRGLGPAQVRALVEERERAPFRSLHDFLVRSRLGRELLFQLALGNAFTCFGVEPRQALWECLAFDLSTRPEPTGQLSLFSALDSTPDTGPALLRASEPEVRFREDVDLFADYRIFGLSTRGHPMPLLRSSLPRLPKLSSAEVRTRPNGAEVRFAGLVIVRQRPPTAKGTTFATLEDEAGFVDLILWKSVHEAHEPLLQNHSFLVVTGTVQREGDSLSLLVRKLEPVFASEENLQNLPSHSWH